MEEISHFAKGTIGRRALIKMAGAMSITSLTGCLFSQTNLVPFFSTSQDKQLHAALQIIFPDDGNGPDAEAIHAVPYFHLVMHDQGFPEWRKNLARNGLKWLDEESVELHKSTFVKLDASKRYQTMEQYAKRKWGERWIGNCLHILFEALLADPIYGGNPDGIGWKWLDHPNGLPGPNSKNKYPSMIG